jgi:hypothetical protein
MMPCGALLVGTSTDSSHRGVRGSTGTSTSSDSAPAGRPRSPRVDTKATSFGHGFPRTPRFRSLAPAPRSAEKDPVGTW